MAIYLKKFATEAAYEAAERRLILPNVSLTLDNNTVHYKPWVDPCISEKVETTYEWVEIGGLKWATKNVGAKTITDYGQYFSWGEVNGYTADQVSGGCKEFSWTSYKYWTGDTGSGSSGMTKYNETDGKKVLESVDDAATVNMGSGWRMPTEAEYEALCNAVNSAWTADYQGSGVAGLVCTDKTDNSKTLFFPACGYGYEDGVYGVGSEGAYYPSSIYIGAGTVNYAREFGFNEGKVSWMFTRERCRGLPVRAVVNE